MLCSRKTKWLLFTVTIAAAQVAITPLTATAAAFTPGDLVVSRVGTGTGALGSAATAEFLDEYNTAGTLVQSIPLPTSSSGANLAFTNSGSASSEGALTRSADGQYLVLAGYGAAPGTANVASSTSAAVPRVIARVDANGTIDTTTALTDADSGNNVRSATSIDGTSFWVAGAQEGLRYATLGATTSTSLITSPSNTRNVTLVNGQLYVSTGNGTQGLYIVGTGAPTTAPQTATILTGTSLSKGSPYDYLFTDSSTLYVADDRTSGSGGIEKFSLSGSTWTLDYSALDAGAGLRSLTLQGTTLYGITTDNHLVSATDTGTGFTFNTLATGSTNMVFRGVDLAPVSVPEPTAVAVVGISAFAATSRRRWV